MKAPKPSDPRDAIYLARDALTGAIIMRERLPAHPDHAPALRAIMRTYLDQADAGIRAVRAELDEEEQQPVNEYDDGEEDQP